MIYIYIYIYTFKYLLQISLVMSLLWKMGKVRLKNNSSVSDQLGYKSLYLCMRSFDKHGKIIK